MVSSVEPRRSLRAVPISRIAPRATSDRVIPAGLPGHTGGEADHASGDAQGHGGPQGWLCGAAPAARSSSSTPIPIAVGAQEARTQSARAVRPRRSVRMQPRPTRCARLAIRSRARSRSVFHFRFQPVSQIG